MIANMPDGQLHLAWQKLSIPRKMSKDPGGSQCSQVGSGSEILRRKKKAKHFFLHCFILQYSIWVISLSLIVSLCLITSHHVLFCTTFMFPFVPWCLQMSLLCLIMLHYVLQWPKMSPIASHSVLYCWIISTCCPLLYLIMSHNVPLGLINSKPKEWALNWEFTHLKNEIKIVGVVGDRCKSGGEHI